MEYCFAAIRKFLEIAYLNFCYQCFNFKLRLTQSFPYLLQYVHYLQRKYSLSSFNLLGHTAPAQAATLLIVGPFLDYWLTEKRVDVYDYNFVSVVSARNTQIIPNGISFFLFKKIFSVDVLEIITDYV